MKKLLVILFSLTLPCLFAVDMIPQPDGTVLYSINGAYGSRDFYTARIDADLSKIDIRNKVIYFVTNDPHLFDDFPYHFTSRFSKEIIASDWFRRQDFQTEDLYNICKELREIGGTTARPNEGNYFTITVIANTHYGYLVKFMGESALSRIFFELK